MSKVILTDGGMGQELVRRSASKPTPLWSARVLIDEPDLVRDLHVEFIEAGAKVITINTYAATPERLAREGVGEMFERLQKAGIDLARQARDTAGDVAIAGCLPPLFGSYAPKLTISYADTLAIYRRIVAEQADHVDLFLCETMASAEEAHAAATAACESGKPVWVSWTLADDRARACAAASRWRRPPRPSRTCRSPPGWSTAPVRKRSTPPSRSSRASAAPSAPMPMASPKPAR